MKRLTPKEAAAEWKVSRSIVYWMCQNNQLPPGYTVIVKKGKNNTYLIFKGDEDERKEP